jgi:hypothetical protein
MTAPQVIAIRPRSLANVLADIREAAEDYTNAIRDLEEARPGTRSEAEADDRATEADQRWEALREEANERLAALLRAEGVTWAQVQRAQQEALL